MVQDPSGHPRMALRLSYGPEWRVEIVRRERILSDRRSCVTPISEKTYSRAARVRSGGTGAGRSRGRKYRLSDRRFATRVTGSRHRRRQGIVMIALDVIDSRCRRSHP